MIQELFMFFYNTFLRGTSGTTVANIFNYRVELYGNQIALSNYLAFLGALICFVIIFVLCCLFVWKIIKLIGGLIR